MECSRDIDSDLIDNLIIGTGAAATATAKALDRRGEKFEVLDVAFDLANNIQEKVNSLSRQSKKDWDGSLVKELFPPPVTSSKGVEKRLIFGSNHPYELPDSLDISMQNGDMELSHAFGGLGNVWGAAVLPYSEHTLRNWPVSVADMTDAYKRVLEYVPLSGVKDSLQSVFPIYSNTLGAIKNSAQVSALLKFLRKNQSKLESEGLYAGHARVAVDSLSEQNACRYCGHCLEGCVYESIFNPKQIWQRDLGKQSLHKNHYVLEFQEFENYVEVLSFDIQHKTYHKWKAKRLLIGAGQFGTTKLIARSLKLYDQPIHIADSQYFFFPFLSYKSFEEQEAFTLAELFFEIINPSISDEYMHFQLYSTNPLFKKTLRAMVPEPIPVDFLAKRFHLIQGYLDSKDSGYLEMTVKDTRHVGETDSVVIRAVSNPMAKRIAKKAQHLLRKNLMSKGVIPPMYMNMVTPGRSFHTGGSFPMGKNHAVFKSDTLGRPADLKRVHIMDSASFPNIPSSSILISIMANADRIVDSLN
jgi:hypothetical protein